MFAFALTFLAVSLLLPQAIGSSSLPSLPVYLGRLEPAFIGYVLSFFVVASWWNIHHRLFSALARYDYLLVRLNTMFLLVISVTPFLVWLLFSYAPSGWGASTLSSRIAVALFGSIQALGGLVLLAIWHHATRDRRLVRASLSDGWVRSTERSQALSVVVFTVSVGVAFVSPQVAELVWIVMIFGFRSRIFGHGPPAMGTPGHHRSENA